MDELTEYYYYDSCVRTPATLCLRVYHASDVDKLISKLENQINAANNLRADLMQHLRRQKYKRCLAMAKWSDASYYQYPSFGEISPKEKWWQKWHVRWLELAEKFK